MTDGQETCTRKKRFSVAFCILGGLISLGAFAPAQAATIFNDDFQDGNYSGWTKTGAGGALVTSYAGNYSVRLTNKATITRTISTAGYTNVQVSAQFAASSLEGSDACIAEASGNGSTWVEIVKVVNGQDNGVTLYPGSASDASFNNNASLQVRGRAAGNNNGDYCWFDNVAVTGDLGAGGLRTVLSYSTLSGSGSYASPVDFAAYAEESDASAATNTFSGALSFTGSSYSGGFSVVRDDYSYASGGSIDVLPAFDFEFVQSGDDFIPATRGSIPGAHPNWEIILEPGKVWDEPGDNGYSRVALPFALQEKNANCTHNGVITFLFKDGGLVSDAAYQIASETCLYFKFNMWGLINADYDQGTVTGAASIISAYQAEEAGRMTTKPISAIAADYPGTDASAFGASSEVSPAHMSAFGFVYNGVHYVGGCGTRYGDYPYCDVLDLPSYSTAKSIFGGIGLMRLEKLYPGVMQDEISLYVPDCDADGDWDDVSLEDAADMATGNYSSSGYQTDEGSAAMTNFFLETTHADKIDRACTQYPRKAAPGSLWVYHSSDTYILGTAMQAYYKSQAGSSADIWDDLLGSIWSSLGLSQTSEVTRRTLDATAQPFTGWGLMFHRDDIAKIADFLNVDDGEIGGVAQLDATEFAAAMQKTPSDRGLVAGDPTIRYNNGFWAWNAQSYLGCGSATWIPFMSGFGGITVALLPNGGTYYYFSDNAEFAWGEALAEAHSISSVCP
ncbi:hypothetical protein [Hyphococcus sp.]|jgi:hypothetical protein|uniref:hypothetical protein n=1 Tax=Hyphococcus sp. TaxID=2038636 RepID=UPI003D12C8A9